LTTPIISRIAIYLANPSLINDPPKTEDMICISSQGFVGRIISRCMQTEEKPVVNYRELLRLKSEGTIWIYAMIQVLEMRFFRFT
jgi:hypothetical protein